MPTIERLTALEILDSRGRPTVQATCHLKSGVKATTSVPSGASTGTAEALELRDGEATRYNGLGCRKAVSHINVELNQLLSGKSFSEQKTGQEELDQIMLRSDGTPNKARLGANAILAVSLSFARAVAVEKGVPLYHHFADLLGSKEKRLPRLTVNLFSGGKHAGGQVPIQDVLIVPVAASTIDESLAIIFAVYQKAAALIQRKYQMRLLRADEGGLAPPCQSAEAMLQDAVEAIRDAGFEPGRQVALAVDVASSHFFADNQYHLGKAALSSVKMIDQLAQWIERYPIISLEDGLAEDDWNNWPALRQKIGEKAFVLGDDFLCTNPERIKRAISTKAANALLLKVNQVGTLSEAATAYRLARSAGWKITVSARSGETEDNWLADLAVGWAGDHIKIGSITQSERLAKYNRLLEIEATERWPLAK